jgi:hypothetical protein
MLEHLVVPEAHDMETARFELCGPLCIVLSLKVVAAAIDLDDQLGVNADEIGGSGQWGTGGEI